MNIKKKSGKRMFDRVIKVGVGYGWKKFGDDQKDDIYYDDLWKSLKKSLEEKCVAFDQKIARVDIRRLRASHGKLIWPSIKEHIDSSDMLVFDIAKVPVSRERMVTELCSNVLIELGAALSNPRKPVLLMCPEALRHDIPSDMSGYLWSLYQWKYEKGSYVRKFKDPRGLAAAFQSMLRDVIEEEFGEVV